MHQSVGLLVGLTLSTLLKRVLSKLLFGVTPFDVPTLVKVPAVLGVATVLASWLPARRAMRLDPVAVIRQELRRRISGVKNIVNCGVKSDVKKGVRRRVAVPNAPDTPRSLTA